MPPQPVSDSGLLGREIWSNMGDMGGLAMSDPELIGFSGILHIQFLFYIIISFINIQLSFFDYLMI